MPMMPNGGQPTQMDVEKQKISAINTILAETPALSQFNVPSENLMDLFFNGENFNSRIQYLSEVIQVLAVPPSRQNFSKPELEQNPNIMTILDLIADGNNYTSSMNILTRKRFELETSYLKAQDNRDVKSLLTAGELGNLDKDGLISLLAQLNGVDGTILGPIDQINKTISDLIPYMEMFRVQNVQLYQLLKILILFIDYGVVVTQILSKVTKKAVSIDPSASMRSLARNSGYELPKEWTLNQESEKSVGSIIQASSNLTGLISQTLLNAGLMFNQDYFTGILSGASHETLRYANKLAMGQGGMGHIVEDSVVQGLGTAYCQVTYFITQNTQFANNPQLLNVLYAVALLSAVANRNNPQVILESLYNILCMPYSPQNLTNAIYDIGAPYAITMGLNMQNPNLIIGYYRMSHFNSPDYAEFAKRLYVGDTGYGGMIDMNFLMQLKQQHQQGSLNIGGVTNMISTRVGLINNTKVVQDIAGDIINVVSLI